MQSEPTHDSYKRALALKAVLAPSMLAYSIPEAVAVSGISRSRLYLEIKAGRLRAVKSGKRTLITADDLRAFIATLPTFGTKAA